MFLNFENSVEACIALTRVKITKDLGTRLFSNTSKSESQTDFLTIFFF